MSEGGLDSSRLLSGSLLARNSLWNLLGLGLPLGVAVVAIPPLIAALGTERFGLLAIGWAAVGYFSLFDLGLGRALTKLVAERLARGQRKNLPQLVGTGIVILLVLGVLASAAVLLGLPLIVDEAFHPAPELRDDVWRSLAILGLTLPSVIVSAALSGILEAQQRFRTINAVRIPAGVFTYLGPLMAVAIDPSPVSATAALFLVRLGSVGAYLWACRDLLPPLRQAFDRTLVKSLLSFGGWITVSNVVGPLLVYFDRFVIGALLSLTAIAYYATPYEAVTRLWVLPQAVVAVVFPALTMAAVTDERRLGLLYVRSIDALMLLMFPPVGIIVLLAPELLSAWLGPEWGVRSAAVLQWLAVGVFINSIARVPFSLLQGLGRPDLTALLHLTELPIYALALVLLLHVADITGAAAAWTFRASFDAVALFWLTRRVAPHLARPTYRAVGWTVLATAGLALLAVPSHPVVKSLLLLGLGGAAGLAGLRVARDLGATSSKRTSSTPSARRRRSPGRC